MSFGRRDFLKMGAAVGVTAGVASAGMAHAAGSAEPEPAAAQAADPNLPAEATNGPWRNLRAVKEKKVFDFHTHTWETPVQGKNYTEEKAMHDKDEWKDYTEALIASMDKHGVAQAALSPAFVTFERYMESSYKTHGDRLVKMTSMLTNRTKGRMDEVTVEEATEILKEQIQIGCKGVGGRIFLGTQRALHGERPEAVCRHDHRARYAGAGSLGLGGDGHGVELRARLSNFVALGGTVWRLDERLP